MFEVTNKIYKARFSEEPIVYEDDNDNKLILILDGEFEIDEINDEKSDISLKIKKVKFNNKEINLSKEIEKKLINLILEDIESISEYAVLEFEYELSGKNLNKIFELFKDI